MGHNFIKVIQSVLLSYRALTCLDLPSPHTGGQINDKSLLYDYRSYM